MVEIWARKRQQLVGLPGLMLKGEPTSSFNEVSRAMRIHLKIPSSGIWARKSWGAADVATTISQSGGTACPGPDIGSLNNTISCLFGSASFSSTAISPYLGLRYNMVWHGMAG